MPAKKLLVKRNALIATFYNEYREEVRREEAETTKVRIEHAGRKKQGYIEHKRNRSLEVMEMKRHRSEARVLAIDQTLQVLAKGAFVAAWTGFIVKMEMMGRVHRVMKVGLSYIS